MYNIPRTYLSVVLPDDLSVVCLAWNIRLRVVRGIECRMNSQMDRK